MAFGITPATIRSPEGGAMGDFIQWRKDGVNLGDRKVAIVDFTRPDIRVTRGLGPNAHVATVKRFDPLFGLVVLLLNGTTTLTDDQSSFNRTLTTVGGVALNSSVPLFGNPTYASPQNGAGSYMQVDSASWAGSFGTQEWCIEGWHRATVDTTYKIFHLGAFSATWGPNRALSVSAAVNSTTYSVGSAAGQALNQWWYYACVRDNTTSPNSTMRLYFGPEGGTATQAQIQVFPNGNTIDSSVLRQVFGDLYTDRDMGRHGPFRFTIGNARYYAGTAFAVPAAPFIAEG